MGFLSKWSEQILGALRIVACYMFIQHGTQKLFSFPVAAGSPYELFTLSPGLAGLLEVTLGPLLLIGLFTRPVAFVLSGFMAAAYFIGHAPRGLFLTRGNGGEAAVMYCFAFLYMAAAGGGKWSVDALLAKRR